MMTAGGHNTTSSSQAIQLGMMCVSGCPKTTEQTYSSISARGVPLDCGNVLDALSLGVSEKNLGCC